MKTVFVKSLIPHKYLRKYVDRLLNIYIGDHNGKRIFGIFHDLLWNFSMTKKRKSNQILFKEMSMIIYKYFKNYNFRVKVLTFISHVNPFESNVFFQRDCLFIVKSNSNVSYCR